MMEYKAFLPLKNGFNIDQQNVRLLMGSDFYLDKKTEKISCFYFDNMICKPGFCHKLVL